MTSLVGLDELKLDARHHRDRRDLYQAEMVRLQTLTPHEFTR